MQFLRHLNKKGGNSSKHMLKTPRSYDFNKKIKINSRKSKQNLFDIGLDGFFPGTKLKMSKKIIGSLIIAITFQFIGFATPILAQDTASSTETKIILDNGAELSDLEIELLNKELIIIEKAPEKDDIDDKIAQEPVNIHSFTNIKDSEFVSLGIRTMTSYNSEPGQTDDSPCITANNFNVCEHGIEDTVAANFLKFGTKVRIPDLFGDRIFVVRDRMNKRYPDRMDVWMLNKSDSKQFGVRRAEIQVLIEK